MAVRPHSEVIEACLARSRGTRIVVVGDVMLDRYLTGSVDRISPEAPVPVVRQRGARSAPGGAANVAAGARALGARVELVGVVGRDPAARTLRERLERWGLGSDGLVEAEDRPTTTKLRVVAEHQQMLRIDREVDRAIPAEAEERVAARAEEGLGRADVLVLQDYDKGTLTASLIARLVEAARGREVPIVVDPKLRHFFAYAGASVFKPNARELAAALGEESVAFDATRLAKVAERLGCGWLLVTRGAQGMCLVERGATEPLRIPSRARDVYDVSGAGDTVTAALAVALGGGAPVPQAAWLANAAAGLSVARFGARPVGRRALEREVERALAAAGEAAVAGAAAEARPRDRGTDEGGEEA